MSEAEINADSSERRPLAAIATDAIRYWEPRRLIYNSVLALIVLGYFFASWPESRRTFTLDGVLFLFLLVVGANILYCAAQAVDIFAQISGFRSLWVRCRWLLLLVGIVVGGIITRFFALGFFASSHP